MESEEDGKYAAEQVRVIQSSQGVDQRGKTHALRLYIYRLYPYAPSYEPTYNNDSIFVVAFLAGRYGMLLG